MTAATDPGSREESVGEYKRLLQEVLDRRPSGTRQRLAEALDKNRSFITQISNPAYATPIPSRHLEAIFEICHFSAQEKEQFLSAYNRAHPRRLRLFEAEERKRRLAVMVPDLGDARKNRRLDAIVTEFAEKAARLLEEP